MVTTDNDKVAKILSSYGIHLKCNINNKSGGGNEGEIPEIYTSKFFKKVKANLEERNLQENNNEISKIDNFIQSLKNPEESEDINGLCEMMNTFDLTGADNERQVALIENNERPVALIENNERTKEYIKTILEIINSLFRFKFLCGFFIIFTYMYCPIFKIYTEHRLNKSVYNYSYNDEAGLTRSEFKRDLYLLMVPLLTDNNEIRAIPNDTANKLNQFMDNIFNEISKDNAFPEFKVEYIPDLYYEELLTFRDNDDNSIILERLFEPNQYNIIDKIKRLKEEKNGGKPRRQTRRKIRRNKKTKKSKKRKVNKKTKKRKTNKKTKVNRKKSKKIRTKK